jgi:hypothetical protein
MINGKLYFTGDVLEGLVLLAELVVFLVPGYGL